MGKKKKWKGKGYHKKPPFSSTPDWHFNENNPYQFVPHDESCFKLRGQTPSLSKFDGVSGSLTCEIKTLTPLFIGGKRYENTKPKKIDFFEIAGKPAIPGTSIRGMIRSVLEAATGSCLSIFDDSALHYRNVKAIEAAGKIITLPGNGKPGKIRRMQRGWIAMNSSSRTVRGKQNGKWSNFTLATVPAGVQSGDSIWIQHETIDCYENSRERIVPAKFNLITDISPVSKPGFIQGIYKITGESIRNQRTGASLKKRERIFFETGKPDLYEFFLNDAEKYDEILKSQLETWESRDRFFDFLERNELTVGSLVYFEPIENDTSKVAKKISRVEIPRIHYDTSRGDIAERMGLQKCSDPNNLCPCCRLFGWISENYALRSRVQFTDAVHLEGDGPENDYWEIKLLGTPHPTSCNLYLIDPNDPRKTVRNYDGIKFNKKGNLEDPFDKHDDPTPNWKEEVELRGRKFYYHHQNQEKSYYCHKGSGQEDMRSEIRPVLEGNKFQFKVYFRNLKDAELGMLIWGLELDGNLAHKLGMGKPIGFGSVQIEITDTQVFENASSRYTQWEPDSNHPSDGETKSKDKNGYLKEFLNWVKDHTGKGFDQLQSYKGLDRMLDKTNVKDKRFYPGDQGFQRYMELKGQAMRELLAGQS